MWKRSWYIAGYILWDDRGALSQPDDDQVISMATKNMQRPTKGNNSVHFTKVVTCQLVNVKSHCLSNIMNWSLDDMMIWYVITWNNKSVLLCDTAYKTSLGESAAVRLTGGRWITLHWRHNHHDGVSNHQPHGCLLNRLFWRRSKKTSKLRVTGLCARNSPGTDEFPAQRASNAENVSIWWRHHERRRSGWS